MKISILSFTTVLSFLPTFTTALVGIDWTISDVLSSGLQDITFPFSIANAPHQSGYFFAQQFSFIDQSGVGYTGLQPRPDSGSGPIIRAVFSSFIAGTTTSDANCRPGADGGPSVSCSVDFSGPYDGNYALEILNVGGTTWIAEVVDTAAELRVPVGSYKLPAGTQGIKGSQSGFVEYYPWNAGTHTCSSLPYTSVTFGTPKTAHPDSVGSLGDAYEDGDCVGKVAFDSQTSSLGVEVSVGFK